MDPQFEPARTAEARRIWVDVLAPLGEELRAEVGELAVEIIGDIQSRFPDLFRTDDDLEQHRASSEGLVHLLADLLAEGRDPNEAELPHATVELIKDGARRGVPVTAYLRSMRLGHQGLTALLGSRIAQRVTKREQLSDAVELLNAWLFAWVDVVSSAGEEIYGAERERWLRTSAALQTQTLEEILDGRDVDLGVASRRLRYELDRDHVAIIGWVEEAPEGKEPIALLEAALGEAAAALTGDGRALMEPTGLLSVACWIGSRSGFDEAALDELRPHAADLRGARFAVGEAGRGLAGFRSSYAEALGARRVATLSRRGPGSVTRYRSVALASLATTDLGQARAFVMREIGGLAGEDDATVRVAATLRAFLEEDSSRRRAARRLGIHENTVRYRLEQAEEMLGRPIDGRTLELRAALSMLDVVRDRDSG